MSLLKGLTLDPATQDGLDRLIAQLPDPEAADYAHATPAFAAGGFRVNRPANIRLRIGQMVKGTEAIDAPLRRLLARHSLNTTVVAPLSTAFLVDHQEALAAVFGAVPMRIARLLDERVEVREREAGRPPPLVTEAPDEASGRVPRSRSVAVLREGLWRLCEALAEPVAEGEAGEMGDGRPGEARLAVEVRAQFEERLKCARAELRRLKGVEARAERLERQLEQRDEALRRAQEGLAAAEGETRQLRNRALQTEADLKRSTEQAELRVNRLVEVRLAQEFAGWLGGERATVAEAAGGLPGASGGDPALQRAADALAAQGRADRVSGTRAALRERLERLEAMLARCRDALGCAMRPQTALQAAAGELSGEIGRLRGLLGFDRGGTLDPALAAAVNASTADALPRWRAIIEELGAAGILEVPSHAELQATLRRRQAMLELDSAPSAEAKTDEIESAAGRLRAVLLGKMTGVLLVDGHNVLFGLQARYRRPQDHNYPDRRARDWLVGDLVRAVASHPTCRVRIVFDGPERTDLSASGNVGVVYSGGAGEHRADKVLIEEVRFFRQTPVDTVLLVTNDNGLAAEGVRLGAAPLAPTELIPVIG